MPSADDAIVVKTIYDGTSLKAGLASSVIDVSDSTEKMQKSFKDLGTNTAGALEPMGEQVKSLNEEVRVLNTELGGAGRAGQTAMTEARRNIQEFGDEIGVRIPREVAKFAASLPGIAVLAEQAFSVLGLIGMIQLLPDLVSKIQSVIAAMVGWNEEEQKLHDLLVKNANDVAISNVALRESYREAADTGEQGLSKLISHQKNLKLEQKDAADQMASFTRSINSNNTEVEQLTTGWQTWATGVFGWLDGADTKIKKDREAVNDFQSDMFRLESTIRQLGAEQARTSAEIAEKAKQDAREISSAKIEATKSTADAVSTLEEDSHKRDYELGLITLQEEVNALKAAENQKFQAIKDFYERKKTLDRSNPDAASGQASYIKDNAAEEAAATAHQNKLEAISTEGGLEQRRIDVANSDARIAAQKNLADAEIEIAEQESHELFNAKKISADQLTQELQADETKRFNAAKTALQARLTLAQQDAQKNQTQIITLNGELEVLEKTHQARMTQIAAEGARRTAEQIKQDMNDEIREAEESANKQLQFTESMNNLKLKMNRETSREWLDAELQAINQWYTDQSQTIKKELEVAKAAYGEQSKAYKDLIDKQNQLDLQRQQKVAQATAQEEQKVQQAYMQMFNYYNKAIEEMMSGQDTFQRAFEKSWNQMVMAMTQNILKGLEQWAISLLTQKAFAQQSILVSAKDAAARAWASAPNPIIGAVEAAVTFAAVMAYGSFDRGGIVPNDGFHQLHKNEMVLPAGLSAGLQSSINNGQIGGSATSSSIRDISNGSGSAQGSGTTHLHYSPQVNMYDRNGMKQVFQAHKDDLLDIVSGGIRSGRLSANS